MVITILVMWSIYTSSVLECIPFGSFRACFWVCNPESSLGSCQGDAFILDPNHEYFDFCQCVFGGKKIVSPQRILREKNIDTISRQWACDKASSPALLSAHHACNRLNNSTEKGDPTTTIHTVYQKLIESEGWDISKKAIERHPIIAYLREGKKKEPGWLHKERLLHSTNPRKVI